MSNNKKKKARDCERRSDDRGTHILVCSWKRESKWSERERESMWVVARWRKREKLSSFLKSDGFYLDLVFSRMMASKSRSDLHVACKWFRIPWRAFFRASLLDAHNILRLIVAESGALNSRKACWVRQPRVDAIRLTMKWRRFRHGILRMFHRRYQWPRIERHSLAKLLACLPISYLERRATSSIEELQMVDDFTLFSVGRILWDFVGRFVQHNYFRDVITEAEDEIASVFLQLEFMKLLEHCIVDFHAGCLERENQVDALLRENRLDESHSRRELHSCHEWNFVLLKISSTCFSYHSKWSDE